MKWEQAQQMVLDYLASENSRDDLDDKQVEQLIRKMTYTTNPHSVAANVEQLFPRRMNTGRVVPPRKPDPESLDETIRSVMRESDVYWCLEDATAFLAPIRDKIMAARETVYYTPEGLKRFIDAAMLPIKAEIDGALSGGWAASNYQRFDGGDERLLTTFRHEGHPEPTASAFCGIINVLGKEQNWPLNTNGEEQRLHKAVAMAKRAILQGKSKWPKWEPAYGQVRWHDAAELDRMSVDELLTTIEQVSSLTKQMSGSREDQRERLADFADAAAGIRRYREGDIDSLSGEVRYKESSHNNAYEFVGEHSQVKPSADPRMDRSAVSAALPPNVAELFTDKATGKFYTKTALHKLARTNTQLFRTMMRSGYVDFMNQLLAQPE